MTDTNDPDALAAAADEHDDDLAERIAVALLPMVRAQQEQRRRWQRVIAWIEHGALIFLMVLAVQSATTSRSATEAARKATGDSQVTGCLRQLNQPVTEANSRNVTANAALQRLRLNVEIEAAQRPPGTKYDFGPVLAQAAPILNELDASAEDYEAARRVYRAATQRSVKDPRGFVAACRRAKLIAQTPPD
jgi:hypothetical protein